MKLNLPGRGGTAYFLCHIATIRAHKIKQSVYDNQIVSERHNLITNPCQVYVTTHSAIHHGYGLPVQLVFSVRQT